MPFTLSHPAAVLPLWPLVRRDRLALAPLAIGTMTPDFEFFLHLSPTAIWSHSLSGLVGFCLPVGLAVLLAWQALARDPVCHLLGLSVEARVERGYRSSSAWWLRAAACVLLGAATHLLWDGVTHGDYWGVARWPWLRTTALSAFGRDVPWFNVLQHLSTAVGGLVVLAWLGSKLHRARAFGTIAGSPWRLLVLLGIGLAALALGAWNGWRWGTPRDYWGVQVLVGRIAVGALLGLGLALLAYSIAHRWLGPAVRSRATDHALGSARLGGDPRRPARDPD